MGLASRSRKWWKGYWLPWCFFYLHIKLGVEYLTHFPVSQVWSVLMRTIYHVAVCRGTHHLPPAVFWSWFIQTIKRPWRSRASCKGDSLYALVQSLCEHFLFDAANGFPPLLILCIFSKQRMLRFYAICLTKWFCTICLKLWLFDFDCESLAIKVILWWT